MWLLFVILPTFICYKLIAEKLTLKSRLLHISLAWFLGQFLSLLAVLLLSVILINFASSALFKASLIFLFILLVASGFLVTGSPGKLSLYPGKIKWVTPRNLFIFLCFLFSLMVFAPHLMNSDGIIYRSQGYWDFNIHFPIIQNFVHGDNFPPQNESYSGLPMTYHYYQDFLISIYVVLGLALVPAFNVVTILMFFFMLLGLMGMCDEFFHKKGIGYIAVLLAVTSGSLHFIHFFASRLTVSPLRTVSDIFFNTSHPYLFSFIKGDPAGYNGTMFNIFYFISERQMIFGVLYLFFSMTVLYYRKHLSPILLLLLGCLMGQFFEGHLFIVMSVGGAMGFLLLFDKEKKKTLWILSGFAIVTLFHTLYLKHLMSPQFFYPEVKNFPKFNPNFPTMPGDYPWSPGNMIVYYLYAYGFKILFLLAGLKRLWRTNREIFMISLSVLIPTFIMVNTLQLSPLSVYDNHKWLRPMNMFVDMIAAYELFILFFQKRKLYIYGIIFTFLLTVSGFLELMPFLNSRPIIPYAVYPSGIINDIRINTPPQAVFASFFSKELHLAGRKLYLGTSLDEPGALSFLDSGDFNKKARMAVMTRIYSSHDPKVLCGITRSNKIDYVVLRKETPGSLGASAALFPQFKSMNEQGKEVTFLNVNKGCYGFK